MMGDSTGKLGALLIIERLQSLRMAQEEAQAELRGAISGESLSPTYEGYGDGLRVRPLDS